MPKGILKSVFSESGSKRSLQWDEDNLIVNEAEKVPRMKIDEPKTPFVRARQLSDNSSMEDMILESGQSTNDESAEGKTFGRRRCSTSWSSASELSEDVHYSPEGIAVLSALLKIM